MILFRSRMRSAPLADASTEALGEVSDRFHGLSIRDWPDTLFRGAYNSDLSSDNFMAANLAGEGSQREAVFI